MDDLWDFELTEQSYEGLGGRRVLVGLGQDVEADTGLDDGPPAPVLLSTGLPAS